MLKAMLAAARGAIDLDLPGKDQSLAGQLSRGHSPARPMAHGRPSLPGSGRPGPGVCPVIITAPWDRSVPAWPWLTRPGSARSWPWNSSRSVGAACPFPLITRGTDGGAFSNLGLYLKLSPEYLVLPCFHTHPSPWNELGYETPSFADFLALDRLRNQLGGIGVCDRVFFPSGRYTFYAVDEWRRWFYQRLGQGRVSVAPWDWLAPNEALDRNSGRRPSPQPRRGRGPPLRGHGAPPGHEAPRPRVRCTSDESPLRRIADQRSHAQRQ
jgi:hypothetical protein